MKRHRTARAATARARRPVARLGVLALVLAALVGVPALAASAEPGDAADVGWWTRNPGQSAPDGGFAVATAPDGPVTVAAVTIEMTADVRQVTLTAVETGGVAQSSAGIVVCPTTPGWAPTSAGAFDDAPPAACDEGSVAFERDADSSSWSADVTTLVIGRSGVASLALVPAPDQGPLAAFDVRLAAPTTRAVVEFTDPTAPDSGPPDSGAAPAGGFDFGANSPPPSPSPSISGSGFEPAPTVDPAPVEDAPFADDSAAPPTTAPSLDAPTDEFAFQPLAPASSSSTPSHRTAGKALQYVAMSAAAGIVVGGGGRFVRGRQLTLG